MYIHLCMYTYMHVYICRFTSCRCCCGWLKLPSWKSTSSARDAQVCHCKVGLFCSLVGLFCLLFRPLLLGSGLLVLLVSLTPILGHFYHYTRSLFPVY